MSCDGGTVPVRESRCRDRVTRCGERPVAGACTIRWDPGCHGAESQCQGGGCQPVFLQAAQSSCADRHRFGHRDALGGYDRQAPVCGAVPGAWDRLPHDPGAPCGQRGSGLQLEDAVGLPEEVSSIAGCGWGMCRKSAPCRRSSRRHGSLFPSRPNPLMPCPGLLRGLRARVFGASGTRQVQRRRSGHGVGVPQRGERRCSPRAARRGSLNRLPRFPKNGVHFPALRSRTRSART